MFCMDIPTLSNSVAFSPDGSRIMSGSSDDTIHLWDTETGDTGKALEGHSNMSIPSHFRPMDLISCLAQSTRPFVSGSLDAETGDAIGKPLEGHPNSVYSVAFSPNGSQYRVWLIRQHHSSLGCRDW